MKKTLITLLALGGIAMGATTNDALWGITDFKGTSSVFDINNTGATLSITSSTTKSGYIEISGADFSYNTYKSNGQAKRTYISITFVVDLALLTSPTANTPFFLDNVDGNNDTTTIGWGTILTADRTFKGAWDGGYWNSNNNYTTSALGTTGTAVLTFNTGWPGTRAEGVEPTDSDAESVGGNCYSQVYLNGALVSGDKGNGLAHGSVVNTLYINSAFASAIQEIYVHNSMVKGADATALYKSIIPEPATATLSLLALAGLATRRRRK